MSYTQAIISGIVQGITEFLPISSSGHLAILHNYFGLTQPQVMFDVFLHTGTLLAVLVYFWQDIANMAGRDKRMLKAVLTASVPTAVIGFFFKDVFESMFANLLIIGIMLYVTAGLLFLAEISTKVSKRVDAPNQIGIKKAFIIGIVQGLAIMPGISRSGSTISTGMFLKIDRDTAVRFSFLLSIPAITGALLLKLFDMGKNVSSIPQIAAGTAAAFLFGLGSIYILIKAVAAGRLKWFGIYCLVAGTSAIVKGFLT